MILTDKKSLVPTRNRKSSERSGEQSTKTGCRQHFHQRDNHHSLNMRILLPWGGGKPHLERQKICSVCAQTGARSQHHCVSAKRTCLEPQSNSLHTNSRARAQTQVSPWSYPTSTLEHLVINHPGVWQAQQRRVVVGKGEKGCLRKVSFFFLQPPKDGCYSFSHVEQSEKA